MQVINEELVDLAVDADSKMSAISILADRINQAGRLHNHAGYIESVVERENLTITGIGFGIAIPHGKTEAVLKPFIAFLRVKQPFQWAKENEEMVRLVFLIGVPQNSESKMHLKFISQLSKKLLDDDFRNKLLKETDKHKIYEQLSSIEI